MCADFQAVPSFFISTDFVWHAKVSCFFLQPGLLNYSHDEGDQVDDGAVDGRDQGDFQSAVDDGDGEIAGSLQVVQQLQDGQNHSQKTEHQGEGPDFLDPAGRFPGGEENGDQKNGEDGHESDASIDKESEHKASGHRFQ